MYPAEHARCADTLYIYFKKRAFHKDHSFKQSLNNIYKCILVSIPSWLLITLGIMLENWNVYIFEKDLWFHPFEEQGTVPFSKCYNHISVYCILWLNSTWHYGNEDDRIEMSIMVIKSFTDTQTCMFLNAMTGAILQE